MSNSLRLVDGTARRRRAGGALSPLLSFSAYSSLYLLLLSSTTSSAGGLSKPSDRPRGWCQRRRHDPTRACARGSPRSDLRRAVRRACRAWLASWWTRHSCMRSADTLRGMHRRQKLCRFVFSVSQRLAQQTERSHRCGEHPKEITTLLQILRRMVLAKW